MPGSRHNPMRGAGFTLVEAVICILLIGVALTAALRTVGASASAGAITERRALGMMLAQDLLAEIVDQPYEDPDEPNLLGLEGDELLGDRTTFDDLDDYHGYDESPPRDADNGVIDGLNGWRRTVQVRRVPLDDLNGSTSSDTGAKRITVTVFKGAIEVAQARAVRTEAWDLGPVEDD